MTRLSGFIKKKKTSKKENNLATGVSSTGENFHLSLIYLYPKAQTFVLFQSLLLPWPLHTPQYVTTIVLGVLSTHLSIQALFFHVISGSRTS